MTDLAMQPLDGIDFVRLLRNSPDSPNPMAPVIMITGHSTLRRVHEARDVGVNEFLSKPVTARGVLERISAGGRQSPAVRPRRDYFGPDRRRRADPDYNGPRRRAADGARAGKAALRGSARSSRRATGTRDADARQSRETRGLSRAGEIEAEPLQGRALQAGAFVEQAVVELAGDGAAAAASSAARSATQPASLGQPGPRRSPPRGRSGRAGAR